MNPQSVFVTGTDTNIGKTVSSALLLKLWGADYWKPIQCGDLPHSDSKVLQGLVGDKHPGSFHPERYAFSMAASPHVAAKEEGVEVRVQDFQLPESSRPLIVEGAGGCLVPLNDEESILDLAAHLKLPVILVTRFYLGSFNHSLLSIEAIRRRGLTLRAVIFNGPDHPEFRQFIVRKANADFFGQIPEWNQVDAHSLQALAQNWEFKKGIS